MNGPIVSYHPVVTAERNLMLTSQRPLDQRDQKALTGAAAVLLPQLCRPDLYELVSGRGLPHFPRQAVRLGLDGKVGNLRLFMRLGLPHPESLELPDLAAALAAWDQGRLAGLGLPLVVKGAGGGEGGNVFLARSREELAALAGRLDTSCAFGPPGLVVQRFVPGGGMDARAVLVGGWHDAFWRVPRDEGEFRSNLAAGGRVVRDQRREDLAAALALARRLAREAAFDVAAVDMLVPPGEGPLLTEINFYFGREALGGGRAFWPLYLKAVQAWLADLGLDPARVRPGW